jgi:hypothetical protein
VSRASASTQPIPVTVRLHNDPLEPRHTGLSKGSALSRHSHSHLKPTLSVCIAPPRCRDSREPRQTPAPVELQTRALARSDVPNAGANADAPLSRRRRSCRPRLLGGRSRWRPCQCKPSVSLCPPRPPKPPRCWPITRNCNSSERGGGGCGKESFLQPEPWTRSRKQKRPV